MLLTTQTNDPKLPKRASTEKSALDLELATVAELKTSWVAIQAWSCARFGSNVASRIAADRQLSNAVVGLRATAVFFDGTLPPKS